MLTLFCRVLGLHITLAKFHAPSCMEITWMLPLDNAEHPRWRSQGGSVKFETSHGQGGQAGLTLQRLTILS